MDVHHAIQSAERILAGPAAPDGARDPRWQAIIEVGEYIDVEPDAVWLFIERWGTHSDDDLRAAIATCLLEHLLEVRFEAFFPRVQRLVRANRCFADTFVGCAKFGQSEESSNSRQFDALKREASKLAGSV
jgi:hypothetical protein